MPTRGSTFEALLETAPDAMLAVDISGRVVLANAQVEALFGYTRPELLGQLVDILVPDAARDAHAAHRARYAHNPTTRSMGVGLQLAARRKDGTEFPAEISLSSIQTDDGLIVSAAVRDITERLEAERDRDRLRAVAERERVELQLQRAQRLESLGQLAGGVAHDFNNLLAVILNYTAFVAEEVGRAAAADPDRWTDVGNDVEQVRRAAERATELTRQLLAFGRREIAQPLALDLNEVLEGVEPLLRRTLGEHIELRVDPSANLWPVVADPGQVEQVLVNLAVNARDAMPGGGTLSIDTTNIVVDVDYAAARPPLAPGRYVRVRVSDSGTGMTADVLDHAFEPFFTTKPKGEGTGLGLATVYGIITQAGGHVQIYSEAGLGTTFTALLPATDQPVERIERPAQALGVHGDKTVLVVEDEDAMREVTRRILDRNGYTVLLAASGAEAVRLAERHPGDIDVLLTDVVMPQMLGKEVAERVTELRPEARVLYMSGYAHPVLTSQGTLDEGVVLVEKPFTEATLLARVRQVIERDE
jgi:PAS domain S-box-containing protein